MIWLGENIPGAASVLGADVRGIVRTPYVTAGRAGDTGLPN